MNKKLMKALKIGVSVAGLIVTVASNYFKEKELDETVTRKVADALAKANGEES